MLVTSCNVVFLQLATNTNIISTFVSADHFYYFMVAMCHAMFFLLEHTHHCVYREGLSK